MKKSKKKLIIGLVISVFITIGVYGINSIYSFVELCEVINWPYEKFEKSSWKASTQKTRFRFVRDILEKKYFSFKSRDELFNELGEPGYLATNKTYASYVIRVFEEGGCGLNSIAFLQFDFNSDGQVINSFVGYD